MVEGGVRGCGGGGYQRVCQRVCQRVYQRVCDRVSEGVLEGVSEGVSEGCVTRHMRGWVGYQVFHRHRWS